MTEYNFDTSEVELETIGLPDGIHKVIIAKEEIVENEQNPTNLKRLVATFEVVEGELKGKYIKANYNLWNTGAKAQQTISIAKQELKRIEIATGRPVNNENRLQGRLLRIEVGPQKGSPDYKEIKKYLPEEEEIPFD